MSLALLDASKCGGEGGIRENCSQKNKQTQALAVQQKKKCHLQNFGKISALLGLKSRILEPLFLPPPKPPRAEQTSPEKVEIAKNFAERTPGDNTYFMIRF